MKRLILAIFGLILLLGTTGCSNEEPADKLETHVDSIGSYKVVSEVHKTSALNMGFVIVEDLSTKTRWPAIRDAVQRP